MWLLQQLIEASTAIRGPGTGVPVPPVEHLQLGLPR
jgi:hypothetical protein